MSGPLTFRTINENQLAWDPELEGNARETYARKEEGGTK